METLVSPKIDLIPKTYISGKTFHVAVFFVRNLLKIKMNEQTNIFAIGSYLAKFVLDFLFFFLHSQ